MPFRHIFLIAQSSETCEVTFLMAVRYRSVKWEIFEEGMFASSFFCTEILAEICDIDKWTPVCVYAWCIYFEES